MASKQPLSVRAAHDPKLLARVLANPGLRSKLGDAQLTPAQRAKREQNTRLNAPLVQGGTKTYRDAAREANAATTVKYGQAEQALGSELGHAQGLARDTPVWYAQYQADLAQHAQNTRDIGTQATTALAGQQAGIRGLDQASLTAQQGQADTAAAQRGATAGNLGPTASDASTVRQALLAAMAGQQTGANAANSTYADTLAHVVAPGQKLQALAQAAGKVTDVRGRQTQLGREKGAFNLSTRQQLAADEGKNVLAQKALGLDTTKAQNAADAAAANIDIRRGIDPVTGNPLPKKPAPAPRGYGPGAPGLNKYGRTYDEWTALSPKQQATARAGKPGKGAKPVTPATADARAFYAKYGVAPAKTAAVATAQSTIQSTSQLVKQIRQSDPKLTRQQIGQLLLNGQPASKDSMAIPKTQGLWATVALDLAWFHGKVTAGTANKLHHAGYSVKTLGLATVPGASSSTYVNPPGPAGSGSRGSGS